MHRQDKKQLKLVPTLKNMKNPIWKTTKLRHKGKQKLVMVELHCCVNGDKVNKGLFKTLYFDRLIIIQRKKKITKWLS